jgi:Leucine-rich repeat (LRR) protein
MLEAKRRIEEARQSGDEVLDLGDLELSELPDSLGALPNLRVLFLGRRTINEEGKLQWTVSRQSPELADLALLAEFRSLRTLDLSGCHQVVELAPLAQLQDLQNLYLNDCTGVTDLAPIAQLKRPSATFCRSPAAGRARCRSGDWRTAGGSLS